MVIAQWSEHQRLNLESPWVQFPVTALYLTLQPLITYFPLLTKLDAASMSALAQVAATTGALLQVAAVISAGFHLEIFVRAWQRICSIFYI